MAGDYDKPLNLGSERMISINQLVFLISKLAGKTVSVNNIDGPVGVMGRNSDNKLIREVIGWAPQDNLEYGLNKTYNWIKEQL
jgi:nucleoside-diphosphate-sugar epimerase